MWAGKRENMLDPEGAPGRFRGGVKLSGKEMSWSTPMHRFDGVGSGVSVPEIGVLSTVNA